MASVDTICFLKINKETIGLQVLEVGSQRCFQKQPSKGLLIERFSKNMQQIYWRTPMPKSDFNKVALQLHRNHTSA